MVGRWNFGSSRIAMAKPGLWRENGIGLNDQAVSWGRVPEAILHIHEDRVYASTYRGPGSPTRCSHPMRDCRRCEPGGEGPQSVNWSGGSLVVQPATHDTASGVFLPFTDVLRRSRRFPVKLVSVAERSIMTNNEALQPSVAKSAVRTSVEKASAVHGF